MSDRRLQVFHTVGGVLSFTRAAELLHMTQPAVTHQIRQLEEELNARLFDRTNNRISLTAAGEQVIVPPDHALARQKTVSLRELTDFPFIHREGGSGTRSVIERYFSEHGISENDLNRPFELGSTEAIKGAVQAGCASILQ